MIIILLIVIPYGIIDDVSARCIFDDGKVRNMGRLQDLESHKQVIVPVVNETINETINETETVNETVIDETITVYCYPSSHLDSGYLYKMYKTIWLKSVLDICELNPKGVYEKEFTRISDNTDYSCLTGLEKDYHGFAISEYLISIEEV